MVAETADHFAGVTVVVRVASVRGVQAQFPALVHRAHVLVHRVDRFQDHAVQLLELAQLGGLLHAVVLHVIVTVGGLIKKKIMKI